MASKQTRLQPERQRVHAESHGASEAARTSPHLLRRSRTRRTLPCARADRRTSTHLDPRCHRDVRGAAERARPSNVPRSATSIRRFASSAAFSREEVALYWQLALKVVPTLHRLRGSTRALPFIEDLAIPPEALPRFLIRLQNVFKMHQVTASLFGHAGHGHQLRAAAGQRDFGYGNGSVQQSAADRQRGIVEQVVRAFSLAAIGATMDFAGKGHPDRLRRRRASCKASVAAKRR